MKRNTILKLAGIFVLCILVLSCVMLHTSNSSDATEDAFYLKMPKRSIKTDNKFTVDLTVQNNAKIQEAQATILYDPDLVTYLSSDNDSAITGDTGRLTLKDTYTTGTTKKTYHLTFQATALGTCTFSLEDTSITLFDNLKMIKKGGSKEQISIVVNNKKEKDCTLEELVIGAGELSPKWDPDTKEYTVTVPKDTKIFTYSATPSLEDATVESQGPDTLKKGTNIYKIQVTAPSGNKTTYTITVIRK